MQHPESPPTAMGSYARGRQPGRRKSRHTLLLLAAVCLLGLVVVSQLGENGIISLLRLGAEVDELEMGVSDLENGNAGILDQIESLRDDPETLEKVARERYNMNAPGEEVLLVLPPQNENPPAQTD